MNRPKSYSRKFHILVSVCVHTCVRRGGGGELVDRGGNFSH